MKVLYVTTISATMGFFPKLVKMLINEGHSVEIATNCEKPVPEIYNILGCKVHDIPFSRSPFSKNNIKAYKMFKQLVESEHYDIVHTHTPVASMIVRLACRDVRRKGTKIFYTAHGFHFYSGAPLKNWLLFYPVEKICACWTDVLITINKEDYERAKRKFKINRIEYVPGVGIDVKKFANDSTDKEKKRKTLGIPQNAYVLLSIGELNVNKNHKIVLQALGQMKDHAIHYVIAGKGNQDKALLHLAHKNGIADRFHLLGYRSDVSELYKMADLYVLPSIREGLNVSVMEAMSSGLPCIVSDIRGNRDMIDDGRGGRLFNPTDAEQFIECLKEIKNNSACAQYNSEKSCKFNYTEVNDCMMRIYRNEIG